MLTETPPASGEQFLRKDIFAREILSDILALLPLSGNGIRLQAPPGTLTVALFPG